MRRGEARRRAAPLFERFGLGGFERTPPYELSGGMRQRVAFMRTLLPGRPLLLLDEPFASLDSLTRAEMQSWLAEALEAEPRTTLLVTHDVEEALYLADRVAVMSPRPGRVVAELDVPLPRPRPRRETVTDPAFVELKEQALEALGLLRRALPAARPAPARPRRVVVGGELGLGRRPAAGLAVGDVAGAPRRPRAPARQRLGDARRGAARARDRDRRRVRARRRDAPGAARCATPPTRCWSPRRRSRSSSSPRSSCWRSTTASGRSSRSWR